MKRALAVATADLGTPAVLWSLFAGELAIGFLLILSGRLPAVLVRSLRLFLRF